MHYSFPYKPYGISYTTSPQNSFPSFPVQSRQFGMPPSATAVLFGIVSVILGLAIQRSTCWTLLEGEASQSGENRELDSCPPLFSSSPKGSLPLETHALSYSASVMLVKELVWHAGTSWILQHYATCSTYFADSQLVDWSTLITTEHFSGWFWPCLQSQPSGPWFGKWRNNEKSHWLWENLRHDHDTSRYITIECSRGSQSSFELASLLCSMVLDGLRMS